MLIIRTNCAITNLIGNVYLTTGNVFICQSSGSEVNLQIKTCIEDNQQQAIVLSVNLNKYQAKELINKLTEIIGE